MNIWTRNCGTFYYDICSDLECEIYSVMPDSLRPHGLYSPCNSLGQNTGMGSLSLLQGIFPTQGLNPGLLHCRQILYQLKDSHWGIPAWWDEIQIIQLVSKAHMLNCHTVLHLHLLS